MDHSAYRPNVGLLIVKRSADGPLLFMGERISRLEALAYPWQFPQGGIDPGEAPDTAAYRELTEETGLQADSVRLFGRTSDWLIYDFPPEVSRKLFKGKYKGQRQLWYGFEMLADDGAVNIQTDEPEFCNWQWAQPQQAHDLAVPFKRDIYAQIVPELLANF